MTTFNPVPGLMAVGIPAMLPGTPFGGLVLGPFVFQSYEIPEKLTWGGKQRTAVHTALGGPRAIDTLGSEPEPLRWAGRFQGNGASDRARGLDGLRQQGNPLPLTWGNFSYLVIISKFTAEYQQPWQVPYSIECLVVAEPACPTPNPVMSPIQAVLGDAADALGLGGIINDPGLNAALSSVQTAAGVVQTTLSEAAGVAGVLGPCMGQLQASIGIAQGVTGVVAAAADGQILAASAGLAGVVAGVPGRVNAAALLSATAAVQLAASSRQVQGLLGRVCNNNGQVCL